VVGYRQIVLCYDISFISQSLAVRLLSMDITGLSLHQEFTLRRFNDEVLSLPEPQLRLLAVEMMVTMMKKDNAIAEIIKKQLSIELPTLNDMG
jgi:hypothetical protein